MSSPAELELGGSRDTDDYLNVADHMLAAGRDEDVAVVETGRRHTYAELRTAASGVAARLRDAGLPPGSRVGLIGPNSFFWVAAYLGTIKTGHISVPLSDKLTPADVRRNLELVDCTAVLADRRTLRQLEPTLPPGVLLLTDEILAAIRQPPLPALQVDPDADAVLMFTSGTTSTPKAVRITHRNLRANTESIVTALQLRREDRALVILPFHYCYGASLLHTHLRVGGRMVLCNSFTFPETAVDLLVAEECTVFAGVPSSFQLLLRACSFATRPTPSLRLVQQAGGKLPPVFLEELLAAKPQSRLYVMYGQTEATARLSILPPEALPAKIGSIGRGIPGVELVVLDDGGRAVAPGVRGEIYARGENVSPGYYRDPAASAEKFTPLGLRTGDLAVVDEDGFIYVVDRRDDFIKSWGYRISSQEVEACALHVPELLAAAAVGVPDDTSGEAVTLFASLRPGVDADDVDVLAHCRQHLAKHMVPRRLVLIDALPLNANGKVDKRRLRELAGATAAPAGAVG